MPDNVLCEKNAYAAFGLQIRHRNQSTPKTNQQSIYFYLYARENKYNAGLIGKVRAGKSPSL